MKIFNPKVRISWKKLIFSVCSLDRFLKWVAWRVYRNTWIWCRFWVGWRLRHHDGLLSSLLWQSQVEVRGNSIHIKSIPKFSTFGWHGKEIILFRFLQKKITKMMKKINFKIFCFVNFNNPSKKNPLTSTLHPPVHQSWLHISIHRYYQESLHVRRMSQRLVSNYYDYTLCCYDVIWLSRQNRQWWRYRVHHSELQELHVFCLIVRWFFISSILYWTVCWRLQALLATFRAFFHDWFDPACQSYSQLHHDNTNG